MVIRSHGGSLVAIKTDLSLPGWAEFQEGSHIELLSDASDATKAAARAWAIERGYSIDSETPVLWTLPGAEGASLTTSSVEELPVAVIAHTYRGLLRTETCWRLADIQNGTPKAGAHPVFERVYSWTMDANLGPVARPARVDWYSTAGAVIQTASWPTKTYTTPMGQARGVLSAREAGRRRRSNVVGAVEDIAFAGIMAWLGAGNVADPATLAAALAAVTGTLPQQYESSPAAGPLLSAAITGATATGNLAWLAQQVTWLRWDDATQAAVVATGTARAHMLDELVQPS